ncbi:MAG: GntR family transcriptional regulator [Bacillota bacterium]|jgi:DNA-binding GntR family transcriptional regulator|uniref:FCD domain-containing protein n=1 Tax=Thermanaerosceptrum fracticalcis TaxID=1712410 RepID=A0A7G6E7I0_THEFR|nr:GntR family transcriptional regulator [Thermanaerosceptrum fracticalcis]QNB48034.1 FCD domain-containing protein [Thermanaerosceptrum fracticalcis]
MAKDFELSSTNDASLRTKVFKYVKSQIINGVYSPGENLVESKLAEELKVSRTPIREAIRLLEVEGLVETTPNKGAIVLGISSKDVEDIYAIRQLVEGLAARWAAEKISPAEIKELQKLTDLMEFYSQKGDQEEVASLDTKFHEIIYEASGSKILNLTLSNLHQFVQLSRVESLKVPHRIENTLAEHRAVLNAFLEKNPDKAEKALTEHVKQAYLNIMSHRAKK